MIIKKLEKEKYSKVKDYIISLSSKNENSDIYNYTVQLNDRIYILKIQFSNELEIAILEAYCKTTGVLITDNDFLLSMITILINEVLENPLSEKENIFSDYSLFVGDKNPKTALPNFTNWIVLSQQIKDELKDKSYLFDEYLCQILTGLDAHGIENITEEARKISQQLYSTCNIITYGYQSNSALFREIVTDEMKLHPIKTKEKKTKTSYYYTTLLYDIYKKEYLKFYNKVKPNVADFDIVAIRQLYNQISELLEDKKCLMIELNRELKQFFVPITYSQIYAKYFSQSILISMLSKDIESGNKILKLVLDKYRKEEED